MRRWFQFYVDACPEHGLGIVRWARDFSSSDYDEGCDDEDEDEVMVECQYTSVVVS